MSDKKRHELDSGALEDLDKRLQNLRRQSDAEQSTPSRSSAPIGRMLWVAFNISSDLIAGVLCGLGIGYGLDYWLGTRPAFIAVFLIIGCAAGLLNVIRFLHRYEKKQNEEKKQHPDNIK